MSEQEELEEFLRVDPKVVQAMLQFKTYKELKRLSDKFGAFATFMGPMTRRFKPALQYQYRTIDAGKSGRVWFMKNPQPKVIVGIITQLYVNWFPDTFWEWLIDYRPKKVEHVIGDFATPKHYERGIPFHGQVKWKAFNNDVVEHRFEVFMDGFFIPKRVFNKIVRG